MARGSDQPLFGMVPCAGIRRDYLLDANLHPSGRNHKHPPVPRSLQLYCGAPVCGLLWQWPTLGRSAFP